VYGSYSLCHVDNHFPQILGITYRVRYRGRNRVRSTFSDRNVFPGSTKYVDSGIVFGAKLSHILKIL